jgi:oligopeptide/dipeptide ABC transporter ATP-binding protein
MNNFNSSIKKSTSPTVKTETLLSVQSLRKYYETTEDLFGRNSQTIKAVDGISFDLTPGETFAVVGESGCGKSTMAETLLGLHEPTAGEVHFQGECVNDWSAHVRRRDIQMIFQDPQSSVNERMTVGQIVAEPLIIHNTNEENRGKRVENLIDTVGLDSNRHHSMFPHELSGGQLQRVGIARALALNPSLIIADEPVSALDVSIQAQILDLLSDLQVEFGLTYILITHDMSVVRQLADRVAVMYLGEFVETGQVKDVFDNPRHPYTEALLSSVPRVSADPTTEEQITMSGTPPDPSDPPSGCSYRTRCHLRTRLDSEEQARCKNMNPADESSETQCVACHFRST